MMRLAAASAVLAVSSRADGIGVLAPSIAGASVPGSGTTAPGQPAPGAAGASRSTAVGPAVAVVTVSSGALSAGSLGEDVVLVALDVGGDAERVLLALSEGGGVGALGELAEVPVGDAELAAFFNVGGRGRGEDGGHLAGDDTEEESGELHVDGGKGGCW